MLNITKIKKETIKKDLKHQGYHIIHELINKDVIDSFKLKVKDLNKRFGESTSAGTRVLGLILKDKIFRDFIEEIASSDLVEPLLGKNFIYSAFQANTVGSYSGSEFYHVDFPYSVTNFSKDQIKQNINDDFFLSFQMALLLCRSGVHCCPKKNVGIWSDISLMSKQD